MAGQKTITATHIEYVPPPDPAYVVTSKPPYVIGPDATGDYYLYTSLNEKPTYIRLDRSWFIWWDDINEAWVLSRTLGIHQGPIWTKYNEPITGNYNPYGGASEKAVVSAWS